MIHSRFYRHNSSCTVFWVRSLYFSVKHRGVVPIDGPWSRVSKTSYLKLKCEVSRTEKKVQECDYVFGSSTTFQGRKEWICESRCRQVSVRLRVFAGFFYPYTLPRLQFMLGLHFTPACVLLLVCSLHFTLSLHFTPGLHSAVCVSHWPNSLYKTKNGFRPLKILSVHFWMRLSS